MERVESPTVAICNGKRTILLGTYNYMGMTFDPDVIAAGKKALDEFGSGTTGSRVLNGTYAGHRACEEALKDFYAMDHAMVFSTGYQANLGIISTLAGKEDYIVLDIDSHASIYDGCALGNAQIVPFRHNDVDALEKRLKRIPEGAGKLVVLEGVYSMLGDVAPLNEMVARRQGEWRDGAGRRGPFDGLHRRARPRRRRGPGRDRRRRFHHRHLLEIGRHGRRLLRFEPSQVRDPAAGLPALRVHRIAAAVGGGDRCDLDPQADALRRTSATICGRIRSGSMPGSSNWASRLGTDEPQSAIIAVMMPDLETGAAMWEALLERRPLRQSGPAASDPGRDDLAALLALCGA